MRDKFIVVREWKPRKRKYRLAMGLYDTRPQANFARNQSLILREMCAYSSDSKFYVVKIRVVDNVA